MNKFFFLFQVFCLCVIVWNTALAEQTAQPPEQAQATERPQASEQSKGANTALSEEDTPAPSLTPRPLDIPKKSVEIRGRYALGFVFGAAPDILDDHITGVVLAASAAWKKPIVQIAWYAAGKKAGQGVLAVGECRDGGAVTITRPGRPEDALLLERGLCFPTSPTALCRAYVDNEITADEDFRGKDVVFEAPIADIGRGAFGRPYLFFPSAEGSASGLTCYLSDNDPNLRNIRKGLTVKVRGTVKGFLVQDVILEKCDVLSIRE